ncbi:putative nucleotidyltransferase with HDIG domain [Herbaspirillum sp. Sphag1AN]|uniref:HD-GYP domain-containing protein n=1 Tax=unclassified Herbaspirillum TaxID=2624150 RepID=UPI00160A9501|nr:putative nucleotidyltransferase with HDIG domain [Herbaspirillum sp. Sphag1AN]MBB3247429.1 putative nucleotidyltransferase with HDIG domain [Herbaspirillum sp. Sphag64]
MFKRIAPDQLRLGMYIQEIPGPWMNHPFWRGSFKLEKREDLEILRHGNIEKIVICTTKGVDVLPEEEKEVATTTTVAATSDSKQEKEAETAAETKPVPAKLNIKVSVEQERVTASRILTSSKQAIMTMFNESRMGKAVDVKQALPIVQEITASVSRNSGALISLARLKNTDDYTYMHSVAVCALMIALAHKLGLSPEHTRQAGVAGLLHDIGKMAVPSDILNKPGKLTDDEFTSIKKHTVAGHEILRNVNGISEAALDVSLHHHEKIDGSGYPFNLRGGQISLFAKMGAVCDVYDAITSDRPYKPGWEPGHSIKRMASNEGHFDEIILEAFIKSVGIFPTGSCVLMMSGKIGIVLDQHPGSLLTPKVKTFFSTRTMAPIPIEIIDLAASRTSDKIVSHADPSKYKLPNLDAVWGPRVAF